MKVNCIQDVAWILGNMQSSPLMCICCWKSCPFTPYPEQRLWSTLWLSVHKYLQNWPGGVRQILPCPFLKHSCWILVFLWPKLTLHFCENVFRSHFHSIIKYLLDSIGRNIPGELTQSEYFGNISGAESWDSPWTTLRVVLNTAARIIP